MEINFEKKFLKQLSKIENKKTAEKVKKAIENVEAASSISEIADLKKLSGYTNYFRIKLGDYRIGILIKGNTVDFVCYMHRKDIYNYFP